MPSAQCGWLGQEYPCAGAPGLRPDRRLKRRRGWMWPLPSALCGTGRGHRPDGGNPGLRRAIRIATWITDFYNARRLHSVCGWKSPIDYELDRKASLTEELAA
ncbi:hypothetical protein [Streptomyces sp. ISL-94]|uniref:hypothetical protein n=1 Tax=Streptomyces sp. ISL-94 TaxID=2819190 RepID=UPI001BEC52D8|nr:hypothetical protein [Streptomyces sp. ISL-94]MBT2477153.1 hypothetical protein [Streptomyces sp. ISL-94]